DCGSGFRCVEDAIADESGWRWLRDGGWGRNIAATLTSQFPYGEIRLVNFLHLYRLCCLQLFFWKRCHLPSLPAHRVIHILPRSSSYLSISLMQRTLSRLSARTMSLYRPDPTRFSCVLAPMVRSGELPTRLLSLQYGADLVW